MIVYTNKAKKCYVSIVISANIKLLFLGFRELTRQGKQGDIFRGHGECKLSLRIMQQRKIISQEMVLLVP